MNAVDAGLVGTRVGHSTYRIWDAVLDIAEDDGSADGRLDYSDPEGVIEGRITFRTPEGQTVMVHVRREE